MFVQRVVFLEKTLVDRGATYISTNWSSGGGWMMSVADSNYTGHRKFHIK